MLAQPTVSYADRAKTARPPTTAKPPPNVQNQPSDISQHDTSQNMTQVAPSKPPSESAKSQGTSTSASGTNVNGVNSSVASAASSMTGATETTSIASESLNTKPTAANGHPTAQPAQPGPPPQNVWTVRKEQMSAIRTAVANQQPPPSNTQNINHTQRLPLVPQSAHQQTPSAPHKTAPANGQNARPSKKKTASTSTGVTAAPTVMPTPPDFGAAEEWPAPIEAATTSGPSSVLLGSKRETVVEEDTAVTDRAHSRESSSAGLASLGKKNKWVAIPQAELQAALDANQPSSPRQANMSRGRRMPGNATPEDKERRHAGVHTPAGGSSEQPRPNSGQTSKKSSTAPSPMRTHFNVLPLSGSGSGTNPPQQPTRPFPNSINAPMPFGPQSGGVGQRSHPHSPMTRSPYLSQANTRQNSPRLGTHFSPNPQHRHQQPLRHPLPPNPHAVPPQPLPLPKKKAARPDPSKSQAVEGDIPDLSHLDLNVPKPVFGCFRTEGLGLHVNGESRPASRDEVEITTDEEGIVRWHELQRRETEPERMLKTHGKYGIGVDSATLTKAEADLKERPEATAGSGFEASEAHSASGIEAEIAAPVDRLPLDNIAGGATTSPEQKFSFGSFDGVHSPNRSRLSSGEGSAEVNGWGRGGSPPMGYGHRGYGDDRRSDGQLVYIDGGSGFGRQMNTRRGRGRGGAGNYSRGGFASRGQPGGPYNRGVAFPTQMPPPIITGYPHMHQHQHQPYDPNMPPIVYPPAGHGMEYPTMDQYGQAVPPTPGGSHQPPPMSAPAPEATFPPVPGQSPYAPYMYPPPPTAGYYAPYPYVMPYIAPMPAPYSAPPYPPPQGAPGTSTPPMPMPKTNPGYPLDPSRFYLLGQMEYYFSVQNFLSDMFLRKQMDQEGWINISVIANFPRVRQLTLEPGLVREVMHISAYIEISPDGEKCRMMNQQWAPFVLPGAAAPRTPQMQLSDSQPGFIDPNTAHQAVQQGPLASTGVPHDGYILNPSTIIHQAGEGVQEPLTS